MKTVRNLESAEFTSEESNNKREAALKANPLILIQHLQTLMYAYLYLSYDAKKYGKNLPLSLRAADYFVNMMYRYALLKSTVDNGNYEQRTMNEIQQKFRDRWAELPPFTKLDDVIFNDLEWNMSKHEFLDRTKKGRQDAQANSAWNSDSVQQNPNKRKGKRGGAQNRKNSAGSWNSNKYNQFQRNTNYNAPRRQSQGDNRPGSSNDRWNNKPRNDKSPDSKRPKWNPQSKKGIPCPYEDRCRFKDTCQYAHSLQEIRQYHESS